MPTYLARFSVVGTFSGIRVFKGKICYTVMASWNRTAMLLKSGLCSWWARRMARQSKHEAQVTRTIYKFGVYYKAIHWHDERAKRADKDVAKKKERQQNTSNWGTLSLPFKRILLIHMAYKREAGKWGKTTWIIWNSIYVFVLKNQTYLFTCNNDKQ